MHTAFEFLIRYGYLVLFAAVCFEQMGLPVSGVPVMLAVGALAAESRFSIGIALVTVVMAAVPGDAFWFEVGRRRGYGVLRVLCRISLEPDTCVRRTNTTFKRYGPRTLLLAKFVPGLGTVLPPLAGMAGMALQRFLLFDVTGVLLWSSVYLTLGFIFGREVERILKMAYSAGTVFFTALLLATGGYFCWKWISRRRYLKQLSAERISPEEVKRRMDAGEPLFIVDLRHGPQVEQEGRKLPGALLLPPEELEERNEEIPRDRDIILYCT